ncbi:MAG: glycosyltransferase [Erythrobacter sp.]
MLRSALNSVYHVILRPDPKMRILHVAETLPGGVASYLSELLPLQAEDDGVECAALFAPEDQLDLVVSREGVGKYGYTREGRSIKAALSMFAELRRVVSRLQPDIVHLHSSIAGLIGRLPGVYPGQTKPIIIYTAHGWAMDPARVTRHRSAIAAVEKALARRADAIMNISQHEIDFLLDLGFPAEKLKLVLTGLGPGDVSGDSSAVRAEEDGPIRLFYAGRLDYQKGFDLLYPELNNLPPGIAVCRVAGASVVGGQAQYSGTENVIMLGWLSRDDVIDELEQCDALIMPSRWEGLPIAALEAMRAGKPVLASNRGPFPKMLRDGVDGILMDIGAPRFLERALRGLTRADLAEIGKQARARFMERHQAVAMAENILKLYRKLVDQRKH